MRHYVIMRSSCDGQLPKAKPLTTIPGPLPFGGSEKEACSQARQGCPLGLSLVRGPTKPGWNSRCARRCCPTCMYMRCCLTCAAVSQTVNLTSDGGQTHANRTAISMLRAGNSSWDKLDMSTSLCVCNAILEGYCRIWSAKNCN